jgi:hypothetical protein
MDGVINEEPKGKRLPGSITSRRGAWLNKAAGGRTRNEGARGRVEGGPIRGDEPNRYSDYGTR